MINTLYHSASTQSGLWWLKTNRARCYIRCLFSSEYKDTLKVCKYPLNDLSQHISKIKRHRWCVALQASEASAKRVLKSNGFTLVYNGGSWRIPKQNAMTKIVFMLTLIISKQSDKERAGGEF
jgi:hypothetical protein